ncbi:hypothetical protein XENOCAPTIV_004045 [Xenoophorus captivus]|uniref:Uncharacterized protein n=2 Tax=Goodeidae TaxID=28758 RepID=A0ABV0QYB7_9TELE
MTDCLHPLCHTSSAIREQCVESRIDPISLTPQCCLLPIASKGKRAQADKQGFYIHQPLLQVWLYQCLCKSASHLAVTQCFEAFRHVEDYLLKKGDSSESDCCLVVGDGLV